MSDDVIFSILSGKIEPSILSLTSVSTSRENVRPYSVNTNNNTISIYSHGTASFTGQTTLAITLTGSGSLSQSTTLFSEISSPTNLGGGILDKGGYYIYSTTSTLNPGTYYVNIDRFGGTASNPSVRTVTWSGTSISALSYRNAGSYSTAYLNDGIIPGKLLTSESNGITYSTSTNRIDYRIYLNTEQGTLNFNLSQDANVTFYASAGTQHYLASSIYLDRRPLRATSLNGNSASNWTLDKDGFYYNNTLVSPGNYNQTITLKAGNYQIRLEKDGNGNPACETAYISAVPL